MTLQWQIVLDSLAPGQILFDARAANGDGLVFSTAQDKRVQVVLKTGRNTVAWRTDKQFIKAGRRHRITVILDNGPGIIMGLVDNKLCDGDPEDIFGWHRYRDLDAVKNGPVRTNRPPPRSIAPVPLNSRRAARVDHRQVRAFAIYNRALTVSQVIVGSH